MTAPQSGHPAIKVLVFEEMTNRPLALWTWESGNFSSRDFIARSALPGICQLLFAIDSSLRRE